MFKVGDKVWAKTNRYSMTSYHRPCEVISVNKLHLGRIVVRIAKTGGGYEVDACEFELIPKEGILEKGNLVIYKGLKLKFLRYDSMGTVILQHYEGYHISADIKEVRKVGGFIV